MTNYALSDGHVTWACYGKDTNDYNSSTPSSSLSTSTADTTVVVVYPWVHGISTVPDRVWHDNKQ